MRRTLIIMLMTMMAINISAQTTIEELECHYMKIGYEKTLHMLFPVPVKYLNIGNDNIIGEIIPSCPSIVRLKSTKKDFKGETNVTVVTEDSKYYSYCLSFSEKAKASYKEGDMMPNTAVIPITADKLTHLIYPEKVIYIDYGNTTVEVEKAENVDNIVALKALRPFTSETNLSVITESGKFYTFDLKYVLNCERFSFVVDKDYKSKQIAILDDKERNTTQKMKIKDEIDHRPPTLNITKEVSEMRFCISNIFIDNDIILFKFNLYNRSQIGYSVDFIRFYIQDAKKTKKTAVEQIEQTQLFSFNVPQEIPALSSSDFTIALPKFTIPDKKVLIIEIQEKNGGRHFYYKLNNKCIINADILFPTILNR